MCMLQLQYETIESVDSVFSEKLSKNICYTKLVKNINLKVLLICIVHIIGFTSYVIASLQQRTVIINWMFLLTLTSDIAVVQVIFFIDFIKFTLIELNNSVEMVKKKLNCDIFIMAENSVLLII